MKEQMQLDRYTNEADIWRDAWRIAAPGAANPVAVARTLMIASSFINHRDGTTAARKHPALRLMCGQLAYLYGVDSLGAPDSVHDEVKKAFRKIENGYVDICFKCGAYNDFPCRDSGVSMWRLLDHAHRPHTMDRDFKEYKVTQ